MLSKQRAFEVTLIEAVCPIAISVTATDGTTTGDTALKDQWDEGERLAKSLLTQKIPDSTLMCIHSK